MDSLFFEHREYYVNRLQQLNVSSKAGPPHEISETSTDSSDTAVCVRIRPLSEGEISDHHIQCIAGKSGGITNIYEPRKKINGKPDLTATSFALDEVYGPEKATHYIYDDKVRQLVHWVWEGGMGILLAYGQTGSGKTFTVTELERQVVERLMDGKLAGRKEVHMCIFEIFGNSAYDLLNDRKQISVMEDSFGIMQIVGALEKNPTNTPEFLKLIDTAKTLRSTESTTKNDQSSRSHAVCRIRIVSKDSKGAPEGTFFLVDLAGSEASADTRQHSTERMAETREINKSLTTLKDCIRARALWSISRGNATQRHIHIPFRSSKLTQVLKCAFDVNSSQTCKTLVIACVTPSILDVAHSKNTLRYAEMLKVPVPKAKPRPYDAQIPTTWSNKDVHEWIRENSGSPLVNPQWLAPHEDGTQLCRLQQDDFIARAMRTAGVRAEQAKSLYFKLWSLHIDSRALLMKNTTNSSSDRAARKDAHMTASQVHIKPGMFFHLSAECADGGERLVMIMGPEESAMGKGDKIYVCAEVCLVEGTDVCYELFVVRQRVVKGVELRDEVVMEYDSATRYYCMKM